MKYLFIILVITGFNGCHAQKTKTMEDQTMIPKIDKGFEFFDQNTFRNEMDSISGKRTVLNKDSYIEEEAQNPGYIVRTYWKESYFMISKKFYENGNIEQKAISFNNGYPIGMTYEFSPDGKLINEINTDEGYDYGWQDILEYCEENKITLTKGLPENGGVHTEIYKTENDNKKTWQITYYDYAKEQLLEVTLDGITGEELQRRELEFIGG